MNRFFYSLAFLSLLLLSTNFNLAQDKPELTVKFGGTVQAMASYAENNTDTAQLGFGLRRVRIKMSGGFGEHLKSYIQFELTSPKLMDALIDYVFNETFQIRIGRFKGAGVLSGGLTSHTDIDIIERPATAIYWGRETVGSDYRDYGIAFLGNVNGFNYNLTLHNGDGSLNIRASQFGLASGQNKGLAVSGMAWYEPPALKGFKAGGYLGKGNSYLNDYFSYNVYIYYEPLPYRLKAEIISLTDKNTATDINSFGWYLFGAYRVIENIEALGRFEIFDMNTDFDNDKETYITLGLSYAVFPASWKTAKITGAYVIKNEEGTSVDNNVFYVMFQAAL